MNKFLKFGVLEAALVLAVFGAWRQDLRHVTGKTLLLTASILPGPLLAVYGQVYQTGADAYQLFAWWTLLILAWVMIGQFAPLWLVWLILLNTSVILYWVQVVLETSWPWVALFEVLTLVNGLALLTWEGLSVRNQAWMKGRWLPRILLCALVLALVIATQITIWGHKADAFRALTPFLYVGIVAACLWIYQTKMHDLFMVAVCLLSGIVVVTTLLIKMTGWDDPGIYLFHGLLVVAQASAVVFWLRRIQQRWEQQS